MNDRVGIEPKLVAISLLLAAATFVLDLFQPLGVAAGIPYVAVVLVALWSRERAFVYILASLASVLTIIGVFASTGEQDSWMVLENRGLALFAIWAVALAGARRVADLENADQTLRESERRYALAAGLGGITVWEMIPEEGRLILNDDFKNSFREAENLSSNLVEDWISQVHPEDRETARVDIQSVADGTADGFSLDFRVPLEDGTVLWRHGEGFRASAPGEKPVRIIGTSRDITEQKQAEESLRQSEARLRATMEGGLDGVYFHKAVRNDQAEVVDFEFVDASERGLEMVTLAREELIGTRLSEGYPEAFENGLFDKLKTVLDTGVLLDEDMHALENVDAQWLHHQVVPYGDGVAFTVRDITEVKEAEEVLRRSEASLENAQRIARLGSWDWDVSTNTGQWSDELYRIFGMEPQETEANYDLFVDLVHPDDRKLILKAVEDALSGEKSYQIDHRLVRRDGEIRFIKELAEVRRDENGTPVSMHGTMQDITDLKAVEDALRESEQRLQGAHRMARLGHWSLDLSSRRFCGYGDMFAEFGFYDEEPEFSFEEAMSWVHEADVPCVSAAFERSLADGAAYDETNRFVTKDGRSGYMRLIGEVVRDENGSITGMRGTMQDMTALKAAEAELRESEQRLQGAHRLSSLAHWEVDSASRRFKAYGHIHEGFGLGGEVTEFSFEDALRPIHPADVARVRAAFERSFAEGVPYDEINRNVNSAGQTGYMHIIAEAIRDDAGAVVGLRGTSQDVTALKAAQEELGKTQEKLVTAQRIAGIGSWELDSTRQKAIWSEEMYRIFELDPDTDDAPGRDTFYELVHPDDKRKLETAVAKTLGDGVPMTLEYRLITKLGHEKTVLTFGEATTDERGQLVGFGGTVQDITNLRLAEQKLAQAQKMETVGQLSAGVAHDFNNMLAVVMGNLELAQSRIAGDAQVESLLENALKASKRGAELTQSLLAFSRKQVLFPKPVDVNKAADGVLALARRTIAKSVEITFEPLADLWAADVDSAHLESAVLNLLVNGCTAMPNGGNLKISTWNASQLDPAHRDDESWPTADYVCLAITDTGHGMTPEVLERAIEPFFTTKGMAEGSGLGLSMVYGFVEQSGGLFDIVSEPGVGTKVTLSLPRSDKALRKEGKQMPAERRDPSARTVLLVEDEPRVMETVAFQLSDLGFRVLVAADAVEALRLLSQNIGIDLLFADVVLGPGKNGIDLALEARLKYPDLRVLCTSGYAGEELQARYEGAEDLQILGKPFTLDILSAKLDEVLGVDARSEG